MHEAASAYVQSVLASTTSRNGPIIEIGGRNINGTIRGLFAGRGPYASIDLYEGDGVDLVADVCALDPAETARTFFKRSTVMCVVCCEVLEHAPNGRGICRWAYRVLAAGGVFVLTAANPQRFTHSGIDGGSLHDGEYYHGVSKTQLATWLKPFTRAEITMSGADIYATAWKVRP